MNPSEAEKKYIAETKAALTSADNRIILAKIKELKTTGQVNILSFILELLKSKYPAEIHNEVFCLVSDMRYQQGVPIVMEYIEQLRGSESLAQLISACWQSQLDYSNYLEIFADCFISGSYQDAIESFTVIEEMLMRSNDTKIKNCRTYLSSRKSEVNNEKIPLFRELIKILQIDN